MVPRPGSTLVEHFLPLDESKYPFSKESDTTDLSACSAAGVQLIAYPEGKSGADPSSPLSLPVRDTPPLHLPVTPFSAPVGVDLPLESVVAEGVHKEVSSASSVPPSESILHIMYKIVLKLLAVLTCMGAGGYRCMVTASRTKRFKAQLLTGGSTPTGFDGNHIQRGKLCESEIYCHGHLLDTVQMAHIFDDSKHFVDMKLKNTPTVVMEKWRIFMQDYPQPTPSNIKDFVFKHFDPPGSELEDVVPGDFNENPAFVQKLEDEEIREWGHALHQLWKKLGKKVIDDVREHPKQYSILYVPHTTIVPGGRFREFYYWDSYWTIRGLLVSGMTETVKGMIINFLTLVETFGFVPNGGRIYYSQRSQPPFLIPMMKEYVEATKDTDFLRANIGTLEKEFRFWEQSRTDTVLDNGKKYLLSRYNTFGNEPRPESYREDVETVHGLPPKAQAALHSHIQAACESGWDFSSRWLRGDQDDQEKPTLRDLDTRNIYPVDLNSLLVMNARIMSDFYGVVGDEGRKMEFDHVSNMRNESLQHFLYDSAKGMWFDYDKKLKRSRPTFYASNLFPLWTGAYAQGADKATVADKALSYLRREGILAFPGGFPTSMEESGQQWDFPNGWAPLQHMVIEGLEKSGSPSALVVARELAQKWMRNNFLTWKKHEAMYEKYSTAQVGYPGGGGEYRVVDGFGWSNGVALDLLMKYSSFDTTPEPSSGTVPNTPSIVSQVTAVLSAILVSTSAPHFMLRTAAATCTAAATRRRNFP